MASMRFSFQAAAVPSWGVGSFAREALGCAFCHIQPGVVSGKCKAGSVMSIRGATFGAPTPPMLVDAAGLSPRMQICTVFRSGDGYSGFESKFKNEYEGGPI